MKKITACMIMLLLCATADAARVGVVVEYPNGEIFTRCLTVTEDENAYDLLEKTGLDIAWSSHPLYGHGLCGIEDVGCPSENCWCAAEYWGFYVMKPKSSKWEYSSMGFDGGESCDEHYCAEDYGMIGFAYGEYGTKPENISFEDVCLDNIQTAKAAATQNAASQDVEKAGYSNLALFLLFLLGAGYLVLKKSI